ncbi:zinc finger protein 511 [Eublepharis macularius]|uniref:Zinc finger protein 511 n=1 Tax=Eublepharis macularius TaxID=481883 RepID=A0AA97KQR5_EUBMA|nr:zinc finger protein 511 [Eublepharis macularius]
MALPPSRPGPFSFAPARLRLPAGHPFFEDGDVRRHLYLQGALGGGGAEEAEAGGGPGPCELFCPAAGCGEAFGSLESYEHHYQLLHRAVCRSCRRPFPSAHLLDIHLLEWHDSLFQLMAQTRNMYQCLVESCAEKFKSSKDRKDHLIKIHRYPPDFRFDKPMKSKSTKMKSPSRGHTVPMDVNVNFCEHSSEDAMEIGSSETAADKAHQPGMENPLVSPASDTRFSRTRIPPSVCFGQGSTRSFRSGKKRA